MATMNEADPYDFDSQFIPQPRRTYGKSRGTKPSLVRSAKSEPSTVATSPSPPASPEPQPRPRVVASSSKTKPQPLKYGRVTNPRRAEETRDQQVPSATAMDIDGEEESKPKKRKLVRSQSEKKEKAAVIYTTPDSSPSSPPAPARKQEPIPRSAPAPKAQLKTRGTPERDTRPKNTGSTGMPFSAKTARALDNLSLNSDAPPRPKQTFPLRLSKPQSGSSTFKSVVKKRPSPEAEGSRTLASIVKVPKRRSPEADITRTATGKATKRRSPDVDTSRTSATTGKAPKRRRLIDALNAQADSSSSSSEEEEEEEPTSQESTASKHRYSPEMRSSTPPPSEVTKPRNVVSQVHSAKKAGPKFTYSGRERTMLAEEDDIFGHGLGSIDEEPSSNGPLFNFGRSSKSKINAFDFMDEDDETVNTGAVRSVHELRQAGANSRFADEMEDILDRIGVPTAKPSSLRRGALLELAEKIKEKEFQQQFRNHSNSAGVFKSVGNETDVVSGYSIVAIFSTLLATSVSAHLLQQVVDSGLATLLGRLLEETTDIALLVKDRKQNVSRNGQNTLSGIKVSFLKMPIWEPLTPTSLSPRTLALKCLDLILRQPGRSSCEAEVFTSEITDRIFSILQSGLSNEDSWQFPAHQASTDFYLALYLAETHSISAMQSRLGSRWTSRYVPIVADLLETALRRPADQINDLESLALRVTLNITNNNAVACRTLVEKGLLLSLAESACVAFELSLNSMKVDSFLPNVHESLIMMLGVMINFCVYYPPASESLGKSPKGPGSPLDRLIQIFADNHAKTADVSFTSALPGF